MWNIAPQNCEHFLCRSGVADELSFRVRKLDVVCSRVFDVRRLSTHDGLCALATLVSV